jgi:ParB family chromosome partitioning protein
MSKQAFDAKRTNLFMFDPNDLVVIGFDTDDGPEHPLYDKRAKLPVDEKLVLNIMALGKILEHVGVRKNGDKAEVIFGRQRVKACREANKRRALHGYEPLFVPATIERADESRALEMMVSENEIRKDDGPIDRARKIQKYLDYGHTEDDASKIFGMTAQAIKMQLQLLDLDKSVQKMVESGQVSATAAASLSVFSRDEQKTEAEKLVSEGKTTVADVRHAVKQTKAKKKGGDGAEVIKAPSKKIIKRLLKRNEELVDEEKLDANFIKGIRFAIGDLSPGAIKGLTAMMADDWK